MKKRDNVKIIDSKTITTLSQKVTQQIDPKHLSKFIKTTILNSNIATNKNSFYYYTFIESSLSYEILIFKNKDLTNFILEPFLLLSYYNRNDNKENVDVFILEDRFILFKNQKFKMFKNIQNVSLNDIEIYINQTYNIKVDNFININKEELENLKDDYLKNNYKKVQYKFDSIIEDRSFSVFQIFLLISTMLFLYIMYQNISNSNSVKEKDSTSAQTVLAQNSYNKLERIYKKNNTKTMHKTIELFKYLKVNKITIESFEYKNNKIYAKLVDTNKKTLLDFLTIYTDNMEVNAIQFNQKDSKFKMDVTLKI